MTARCELRVVRYRREPWLVRVYDPRPHAENERIVDYLCPLYDNEQDLSLGRFHSHSSGAWYDHVSCVDLSGIEEEGERILQLEIMLEWIAREGGDWSLVAPPDEALRLEFWFCDGFAASSFDLMYGGRPARLERFSQEPCVRE